MPGVEVDLHVWEGMVQLLPAPGVPMFPGSHPGPGRRLRHLSGSAFRQVELDWRKSQTSRFWLRKGQLLRMAIQSGLKTNLFCS